MAADYRSIGPIAFFQFNSRSATEIVEPHVFEHQLERNAYPVASAVSRVFASMQAKQSIVVDPKTPGSINSPHGLILFDGVCVLCSRGCGFVNKRDCRGYFRFVPMQLAEGRPLADQS